MVSRRDDGSADWAAVAGRAFGFEFTIISSRGWAHRFGCGIGLSLEMIDKFLKDHDAI